MKSIKIYVKKKAVVENGVLGIGKKDTKQQIKEMKKSKDEMYTKKTIVNNFSFETRSYYVVPASL